MLGVTAPPVVGLPGGGELLTAKCAESFEQPVTRGALVGNLGEEHRFLDQAEQTLQRVPALGLGVGHDRLGGSGVEAADEHTETVEHRAFLSVEQRVRPLDRGPQRLVTLHPASRFLR